MIKKLRTKFIAIMMSIVVIILLIIFIAILISTQTDLRKASEQMLNQALQGTQMGFGKNGDMGKDGPPGLRSPTIRATVLPDGEIEIENNQFQEVDEQTILAAAQIAVESNNESGTIAAYQLRYLKRTEGQTMQIAFTDTSMETRVVSNLVVNSLVVGVVAIMAFLVLSIFLAKWAVKPVEEAWQKQRQFVADASHELKTPLTVILSNAEMLCAQSASMDSKTAARVDNIQSESVRMKYLVEDMLSLAKSDAIETQRIFTEVCLSDVIMDSVLLYESDIYDAGKQFTYTVTENIYVQGDAQKLRQLIDIFLDNAKKHGKESGHIDVSLSYMAAEKSARLSVSSEGEPIDREELAHIFERFYRLDKARAQNGGFGLGLSIAESIVAEHKGKIWAESNEQGYNLFYVTLPNAFIKE